MQTITDQIRVYCKKETVNHSFSKSRIETQNAVTLYISLIYDSDTAW